MKGHLKRLLSIPRFMPVLVVMGVTRLALSTAGFARVRRVLLRRVGRMTEPAKDSGAETRVRALAGRVQRVGDLVQATCLVQAVAGQALLLAHGYRSDLQIGVTKKENGQFEAHAWLVRKDRVLIGGGSSLLQRYRVLREDADLTGVVDRGTHDN